MRRTLVLYNRETKTLSTVPPWPPYPKYGDRWEKPKWRRGKFLSRRVLEVTKVGNVVYKDQDGKEKICTVNAFRKWCDGCRARARVLGRKKVVYEGEE